MTSKISLFKISLQEIKHRKWPAALSILIQFLFGILGIYLFYKIESQNIMRLSDANKTIMTPVKLNNVCEYFRYMQITICAIGAILVGLFNSDFLFSKKKVDFFHSLPVKRSTYFFAHYITGFVTWFLPALISFIFASVLLSCIAPVNAGMYVGKFWITFFLCIIEFLATYNVTILAVMLSGNHFNALINTAALGLSVCVFYFLTNAFLSNFMDTYNTNAGNKFFNIGYLSPIAGGIYLAGYVPNNYESILGIPSLFIGMIIATVLTFVLSLLLYRYRKSENAEKGTIYELYKYPMIIAVSVYAGLSFGTVLGELVGPHDTFWEITGVIIGTVLVFGITNIIFEASFRSFFKRLPIMAGSTILTILLILAFKYDWFNYDEYIPRQNSIKTVSFSINNINDQGCYLCFDEDGLPYRDWSKRNCLVTSDKPDFYYPLVVKMTKGFPGGIPIDITYELKSGRAVARTYFINKDNTDVLDSIINQEGFKEIYFPASMRNITKPDYIIINDPFFCSDVELTEAKDIDTLLNIYKKDFEATYSSHEISCYIGCGYLELHYTRIDPSNGTIKDEYILLEIHKNYQDTLAYLKDFNDSFCYTYSDLIEQGIADTDSISWYTYYGKEEVSQDYEKQLCKMLEENPSKVYLGDCINWRTELADEEYVPVGNYYMQFSQASLIAPRELVSDYIPDHFSDEGLQSAFDMPEPYDVQVIY